VNSLEGAVERGLVRESTLNSYVGKWQARVHHQVSGPVHAALDQPPIGRRAKCLFEGPGEVAYR